MGCRERPMYFPWEGKTLTRAVCRSVRDIPAHKWAPGPAYDGFAARSLPAGVRRPDQILLSAIRCGIAGLRSRPRGLM